MPPEAAPAEVSPWPPKDWVVRHEVSTATNWWEVGKRFNADPWKIIFFNFQTYDSLVVNWYMRTRLNCSLPSPDGKSYRFGRIDDPKFKTYVYIPANSWEPPSREDEIARDVVRSSLHVYSAKHINLRMYGFSIRTTNVAAIEMLVGQRIIQVRYAPGVPNSARFRPKQGGFAEFEISFLTASATQQAQVVREGLYAHLVLGTQTATSLSKAQGNVICFVGQLLFLIKCNQPKPMYLSFATQAVIDVAWKIATDINTTGKAANSDVNALETLVEAHPFLG
jgi:hypothetical protein